MSTAIRETEHKYEAPPGTSLPDLRDLPQVATQSTAREIKLEATYHDTVVYDLARAGITLRHRTGGDDAGWHLKVPSRRPATRIELRLPAAPDHLPAEFTELLTARLRGRELHPVARITTRRQLRTLADASGDPLAEVALDTVTAESLGRRTVLTRWSEVEVELADGVEDEDGKRLLKAADRRLHLSGLARSEYRMKLEVALAGELPQPIRATHPKKHPKTHLKKSSSAGDVVLAYIRAQFEELVRWDLLVRRVEPDSIHSMRVAARRIRAALQEFRRLFTSEEVESLIGELRWIGQELGHARDEEVLRDLLVEQLEDVPVESILGPVKARITGHFAPKLADAGRQMREALGSERYIELLDTLEAFLVNPPLNADAEHRGADVLPRLVMHSQARVNRRMRTALNGPANQRDSALHEARKAAKRARYAAEAVSLSLGKKPHKSAKVLKKVQSTLGDHHDAVIAGEALRGLAVRAHGQGENAYTYGLLHAQQDERAGRLAARAHHQWQRADRRKRTAWMG